VKVVAFAAGDVLAEPLVKTKPETLKPETVPPTVNVEEDTAMLVDPVMPPDVAVIVELPLVTPVTTPVGAAVATAAFDDAHVTPEVKALVVPLE
jgi:hypothetical protein